MTRYQGQNLLDAFPDDVPSRALLAAAIEMRSKSKTLLDDSSDDPASSGSVIVHNKNGTTFIGYGVTQDFLVSTLSDLRADHRLVLTMTSRQEATYDWSWLEKRPIINRYEHTNLDWDVVDVQSNRIAAGREITRIDRELFGRCEWHDEMSSMLGDEDQFLESALGICQIDGDSIVCEAYAILSDNGGAEIGAITHESYRRAGNATVTCACLLRDYLHDVGPIYWCCDQENVASANTARRLGFRSKRDYRFVNVPKVGD